MAFIKLLLVTALVSSVYGNSCTITNFNTVESVVSKCTTITVGNLVVPGGKTLVLDLKKGSHITFTGKVTFGHAQWDGPLMRLRGDSITAVGANGHLFHGQGEKYWDGKGGSGSKKPVFLYMQGVGSTYKNLKFKNCPHRCIALDGSTNVHLSGWSIDNSDGAEETAPKGKYGHNTDGFDIAKSHGVTIENAVVINQDDCIAINDGTNINVNKIYCKGSHGLSIASGLSSEYAHNIVANISFRNAVLEGGNNAMRIKTCNDGGPGKIDNIVYENIVLKGPSDFGIFIQQDYSWKAGGTSGNLKGNVPISNVLVENISGFMGTKNRGSTAVEIRCAKNACSGITFKNVAITGAKSKNSCNYEPKGYNC